MKPDMEELLKLYPGFWSAIAEPGQPYPEDAMQITPLGLALLNIRNMSLEDAERHLEENPPTPAAIIELIHLVTRIGKSARSSEIASRKNQAARDFARTQWVTEKANNPKLSKRAFAESILTTLQKRPYLLTVRPETVSLVWLKGL